MLKSGSPWLHVIECDDQEHIARAIFAGNDPARFSDVSFDQASGRLRIEVRLGQHLQPSESQKRAWLEPNGRNALSQVRWDPESGLLFLRAVTACQRLDGAADFACRALASDVHEALEDKRLQAALNCLSQDGGHRRTKGGQPL